jgi:hypothetical protein
MQPEGDNRVKMHNKGETMNWLEKTIWVPEPIATAIALWNMIVWPILTIIAIVVGVVRISQGESPVVLMTGLVSAAVLALYFITAKTVE